jgi:hypothetical protein
VSIFELPDEAPCLVAFQNQAERVSDEVQENPVGVSGLVFSFASANAKYMPLSRRGRPPQSQGASASA